MANYYSSWSEVVHWLNLAVRLPCTEAEGPGRRAALWVQGCIKRCVGCSNPAYQRFIRCDLVHAASVHDWLMNAHQVYDLDGVTFLGGEPMLQAQGLAIVAQGAQDIGLSVMVFSGYTTSEIGALSLPGCDDLLRYTDVLVDGPYEANLPEFQRRWVGSTNQEFHYLTRRHDSQIETYGAIERTSEFRFRSDGTVFINGWPEQVELHCQKS